MAMFGTPAAEAAELFWNDDDGIHRLVPDGPTRPALLFDTFETRGIAVDAPHDRLWWTDVLPLGSPLPGGVIRKASARGGPLEDVVRQLVAPAGVALDPRGGRIYWTDLGDANNPSAVFSAFADGSDARRIITDQWLAEIAGIAVDVPHRKLYFSYVNPLIDSLYPGGIARANLDGSNVEPIVGGLGKPIGVAVDPAGDGVYWADARKLSPAGGAGYIQAADLDGQHQRTILGGLDAPYGVALDLLRRDIYWTDAGAGKIQRTVMSGILPYFQDVVDGLHNPTAIAITRQVFLTGDATGDDWVDRRDVAVVAQNYGRSGATASWFDGDLNGDQRVSLADLAIIQSSFDPSGAHSVAVAPASVPEPPTHALAALAAIVLVIARRFRRGPMRATI
jgi:hypothetical protein